jgi:hypothetical protein
MTQAIHKEKHEEVAVAQPENIGSEVLCNEFGTSDLAEQANLPETQNEKLERLREEVLEEQIMKPETSEHLENVENLGELPVTSEPVTPQGHPKLKAILCGILGIIAVVICCVVKVFPLAVIIAIFTLLIALCQAKSWRIGTMVSCGLMLVAIVVSFIVGMPEPQTLGRTRCCDGTWSDTKGKGACSHHGGVCPLNQRKKCCDGTWSDAKGKGACAHHGGVCEK